MSSITTGEVRDPSTGESMILEPDVINPSINTSFDPTSTFVDVDELLSICQGMLYKSYNVTTNQSETTDFTSLTKDQLLGK